MPTIAYIANEFPSAVEWYVAEEIRELRRRGARVIPCSAMAVTPGNISENDRDLAWETLSVRPMGTLDILRALRLCLRKARVLRDVWARIFPEGSEPIEHRMRALAHTVLGAALAQQLRESKVDHIHAHHGYYASWIAMVAARLLGIPFSLTLHGSDLLLNGKYLDLKLADCAFCRTISEYNQRYILAHFPAVPPAKVVLQRIGVELPAVTVRAIREEDDDLPLTLLAVGRLHGVKNHEFLVRACSRLCADGVNTRCWIVGEGAERRRLEFLIGELDLRDTVKLLGAVPREEVGGLYDQADLVVLTSHSEGIPLVLMEAMARGRLVLAPAITGIPELVIDGQTGFLYPADDLEEFVWRVTLIGRSLRAMGKVRRAAREHVRLHFERNQNLQNFANDLLGRIGGAEDGTVHEDPVLQQI